MAAFEREPADMVVRGCRKSVPELPYVLGKSENPTGGKEEIGRRLRQVYPGTEQATDRKTSPWSAKGAG